MNIQDLTFRQIQIFICVAENRNFSLAAKKLNYSQSMISKTVIGLEKKLGIPLLLRTKNRDILTEAGKSLYLDFKRLWEEADSAVEKAYALKGDAERIRRVGLIDCITSRAMLAYTILKVCNDTDITMQYNELQISELLLCAEEKKLDVIITTGIDRGSMEEYGYRTRLFYHTDAAIFLPASHPLCDKENLTLSDFAEEQFIMLSPLNSPNYLRHFSEVCGKFGFQPNVTANVANTKSYLYNILSGQGIVYADDHTDIVHPDVRKYVLEGVPSDIIIAYLEGNEKFVEDIVRAYPQRVEQTE